MKLTKIAYLRQRAAVGRYDYYGDLWIHVRRLLCISAVIVTGCMMAYYALVLPPMGREMTSLVGVTNKKDGDESRSSSSSRITPTFQLRQSEALAFRQEKERLGKISSSTEKPRHRPSLHLLGERHSGTNWIYKHLEDCFAPQVSVRNGLNRWKHWFQEEGDYSLFQKRPNKTETSDDDDGPTTVVLAQFRNPYHWVEAMRTNPYHSPRHFNLGWHDFVTRPWTMERFGKDAAFLSNRTITEEDEQPTCNFEQQWKYHQVIPCLETNDVTLAGGRQVHTVYELRRDGSGLPYQSLLELRADKIQNFLSVSHYEGIDRFFAVQYENNVRNGTASLIQVLEQALDVKANCQPLPPHTPTSRPLLPDYVEWMNQHVNWETEALIGYERNVF